MLFEQTLADPAVIRIVLNIVWAAPFALSRERKLWGRYAAPSTFSMTFHFGEQSFRSLVPTPKES